MIAAREITARETIAIRHSVLREGMPVESCYWDKDEAEGTFHLGGFVNDTHAGVCTFQIDTHPLTGERAYRLRGMAVLPEYRGYGVAALMLSAGEDRALRRGFAEAWLDARIGAVGFYEKYGWSKVGDEFDIPTAGPHYRMIKHLAAHVCSERR